MSNALRNKNGSFKTKYSTSELIKDFYRVKGLVGQCPSYKDMLKYSVFHPCIIQQRYGKWSLFLNMLGENRKKNINMIFKNKKRVFVSKDGHVHHSKKEMEIDDMLYELGIAHETEVYYPYNNVYNKNTRKRCDFKIGDTYVEYCGMYDYYDLAVRKKYRKNLDLKANMCMESGLNFIHILQDSNKNIMNELNNEFGETKNGKIWI